MDERRHQPRSAPRGTLAHESWDRCRTLSFETRLPRCALRSPRKSPVSNAALCSPSGVPRDATLVSEVGLLIRRASEFPRVTGSRRVGGLPCAGAPCHSSRPVCGRVVTTLTEVAAKKRSRARYGLASSARSPSDDGRSRSASRERTLASARHYCLLPCRCQNSASHSAERSRLSPTVSERSFRDARLVAVSRRTTTSG
jgi:hypothetical protein